MVLDLNGQNGERNFFNSSLHFKDLDILFMENQILKRLGFITIIKSCRLDGTKMETF